MAVNWCCHRRFRPCPGRATQTRFDASRLIGCTTNSDRPIGSRTVEKYLGGRSANHRIALTAPTRWQEIRVAAIWTCIFSMTWWRWTLIVRSVVPETVIDLLTGIAENDEVEHLPLTRRQAARGGRVCRPLSSCKPRPRPPHRIGSERARPASTRVSGPDPAQDQWDESREALRPFALVLDRPATSSRPA